MMGAGWLMMLLMVLFWAVVIGAIVFLLWLLYRVAEGRGWLERQPGRSRAEEILKERYARGEIDQATYQRMRDELH
ncbi:MAG: SHOCT domain-containing protein [Gemmatimonadetes bacterium]|nr:SHOCT domain-containing protein [Gemmatimonadota bacterium]